MKKPILFLSLLCALFALNSFAPVPHTASAVPFITFLQPDGSEVQKSIHQVKSGEWSRPIIRVAFYRNNRVVALEGMLVNVPKEGDATVRSFAGNENLTDMFKGAIAEGTILPGHRIIIDNLNFKEAKEKLPPVVYTAVE